MNSDLGAENDITSSSDIPDIKQRGREKAFTSGKLCETDNSVPSTVKSNDRRRCWDAAFANSSSESQEEEENEEFVEVEEDSPTDKPKHAETAQTQATHKKGRNLQRHVCDAHPGCLKSFPTVKQLEKHHYFRHMHKCETCKRSFPSPHILELHVLEAHDTLFSLMAERKQMIGCFIETCGELFWNSEERKQHCLLDHSFPKSFKLWNLMGQTSVSKPETSCNPKTQKSKRSSGKNKGKEITYDKHVSSSTTGNEHMDLDTDTTGELSSSTGTKISSSRKSDSLKQSPPVQHSNIPNHITFGHSASRAFKPKSSFGIMKPKPNKSNNVSVEEMKVDLSDMKSMLPDINGKQEDSD